MSGQGQSQGHIIPLCKGIMVRVFDAEHPFPYMELFGIKIEYKLNATLYGLPILAQYIILCFRIFCYLVIEHTATHLKMPLREMVLFWACNLWYWIISLYLMTK